MATGNGSTRSNGTSPTFPVDLPADQVRLAINLDLTSTCNLQCIHCWMNVVRDQGFRFRNDMMPLEVFEKIVTQLEGQITQLSLSCAYEPLLNPRLFDYLELVKHHPPGGLNIYTNGVLLTQEKLDALLDAGLTRLTLSMDGATKESFERIRKGAKWEKFLSVLAMIRSTVREQSLDLDLRFNWTLMRSTAHELPALVRLAHEHGFNQILCQHLLRYENLDHQGLHEDGLYWTEDPALIAAFAEAHRLCQELGVVFPHFGGIGRRRHPRWRQALGWLEGPPRDQPLCTQPWTTMRVSPNGSIHPCDGWFTDGVMGNWAEQSWEEIWNGAPYRHLREAHWRRAKPLECCRGCNAWIPNQHRESRDHILPLDTAEMIHRGWFTGMERSKTPPPAASPAH